MVLENVKEGINFLLRDFYEIHGMAMVPIWKSFDASS